MKTVIARRKSFQRIHPSGRNFTPQGASHTYQVEVSLAGEPDKETGMILNIRDIDSLIDEVLNVKTDAPTTEAFAQYLFSKLDMAVGSRGVDLKKLRLYESSDYWVDVWP